MFDISPDRIHQAVFHLRLELLVLNTISIFIEHIEHVDQLADLCGNKGFVDIDAEISKRLGDMIELTGKIGCMDLNDSIFVRLHVIQDNPEFLAAGKFALAAAQIFQLLVQPVP
mgnify:CR=1 FL=1